MANIEGYGNTCINIFPSSSFPLLIPVLHVIDVIQAVRNARKVFSVGCSGVFLICHKSVQIDGKFIPTNTILANCYKSIREEFPNKWIGVNSLALIHQPMQVFKWVEENCPNCNGIWMDNIFVTSIPVIKRISKAREDSGWKGLLFGGVAFKYQEKLHPLQDTEDLSLDAKKIIKNATKEATKYCDVVITSGTSTGEIPSISKIKLMHSVACPLAVSGCGFNFSDFQHYVDIFIAATSLSCECTEHGVIDKCDSSFCELDEQKLQSWIQLSSQLKPHK